MLSKGHVEAIVIPVTLSLLIIQYNVIRHLLLYLRHYVNLIRRSYLDLILLL